MGEQMGAVLTDIDLKCTASSSAVAWCPVNGLVAVGGRIRSDLACVHILNLHCVSRKVTLCVPLQGPADDLLCVAWSPAGCRRVLLTATLSGKLTAWTQQPPEPSSQQHVTVDDWWSHDVADVGAAPATTSTEDAPTAADSNSTPHLITVRWLHAPPCWVWSSSVVQQADYISGAIHDMFAPPSSSAINTEAPEAASSADGAGEFHWVRPGTLALAAVLSSGAAVLCWAHWSAYGQLHWSSTTAMSLAPAGAAVQAADAAVCSEGVAVCYTLQQEPSIIRVVHLQGSPLHAHACQVEPGEPLQLPVAQVVSHSQSPPGGCITGLTWDPHSKGSRLVSVMQRSSSSSAVSDVGDGSGSSFLTLCAVRSDLMVQQGQVACLAAPQQQQLVWLLDGLLVWSGGTQLQLYALDPLQEVPTGFWQPASRGRAAAAAGSSSRVLTALAASPHGVAVAAVMHCQQPARGTTGSSSSSTSRLLVYNVPAFNACNAGPGRAAAGRLLWALLQQKHSWDIVQHLLCSAACHVRGGSIDGGGGSSTAAAAAGADAAIVGEVLALVDAKLAVQQPTLKSTYSARWDVLKLAVLSSTPGAVARIVSIDLRLRMVSHMMKPMFDVMREDAALRARDARPKLSGMAPLQNYLSDLMAFYLACLKTWVVRRSASSNSSGGGSSGCGEAQHVPCIRHFLDWRPCNLLMLLHWMSCSSLAGGNKDDVLYPALKAAIKAASPCKDLNWEQTAQVLFPGPLQLHYSDTIPECLASIAMPPEAMMRHMEGHAVWQQQAPLSDAEITAAATRLGLLPVRPPKPTGIYRRELQQHNNFRLQPWPEADMPLSALVAAAPSSSDQQGATSMRVASMKRRRWEQQLGDALGDVLGPGSSSSSHVFDLAHLMDLDTCTPGLLQSVDGAVLALGRAPPAAGDDGSKGLPKVLLDQCGHGWMYACPITGEMWMRSWS